MTIESLISENRDEILRLAELHGVANVRIFGSMARGEAGPDSDVDLLVELSKDRTLFDLGELLMDLQDLLGRPVDIMTKESLHWYIKDQVLKEAKKL